MSDNRPYDNDYNKAVRRTKCDNCYRYYSGGPHNCTGDLVRCVPVPYQSNGLIEGEGQFVRLSRQSNTRRAGA